MILLTHDESTWYRWDDFKPCLGGNMSLLSIQYRHRSRLKNQIQNEDPYLVYYYNKCRGGKLLMDNVRVFALALKNFHISSDVPEMIVDTYLSVWGLHIFLSTLKIIQNVP